MVSESRHKVGLDLILPPGDVIGDICSTEYIKASITIHIGGVNGISITEITVYDMFGETLAPVILPPGDVICKPSSAQHIDVAVTI